MALEVVEADMERHSKSQTHCKEKWLHLERTAKFDPKKI